MTNPPSGPFLHRRSALAGLGAAGLGLALATTSRQAGAQATPSAAMMNHPMVGTWVVDRFPDDPTEVPTTNIFHADGALTDATVGAAGAWEPTGARSMNFTLILLLEGDGLYILIRGFLEADEEGNTATGQAAGTVVAADGTVLNTDEPFDVKCIRLRVEPIEAAGTPFTDFPTWTPGSATPAS